MDRFERDPNQTFLQNCNVMGLDILRAMSREPEVLTAFIAEVEKARGLDHNLDCSINLLKQELDDPIELESRMRMIGELMALTLQGALLAQHASQAVAEAFCASRLAPRYRGAFGTLPSGLDLDSILDRVSSY